MNIIKDGGASFPVADQGLHGCYGMTLRDWFAGVALQGYFAAPYTPHLNAADIETAEYCYRMADAMIKARSAE